MRLLVVLLSLLTPPEVFGAVAGEGIVEEVLAGLQHLLGMAAQEAVLEPQELNQAVEGVVVLLLAILELAVLDDLSSLFLTELNMIYAIIEDQTNIVVNVTVLDEGAWWTPPDNDYIVDITNLEVGIGWTYNPDTNEWTPPPSPEPPEPPPEESLGSAPNVIE